MHHVMLDLETTGTSPGCGVLSIGAVEFGSEPVTQTTAVCTCGGRSWGPWEDDHTPNCPAALKIPIHPAVFHVPAISRASCLAAGLVEDPATLEWWESQLRREAYPAPYIAGNSILDETSASVAIGDALHQFAFWLQQVSPLAKDLLVYGNGADFDLPILAEAYRRCGLRTPWLPYSGRCYRTLKNLRPEVKLVRTGAHHNALDDARSQAEHAVRLLNELGGW